MGKKRGRGGPGRGDSHPPRRRSSGGSQNFRPGPAWAKKGMDQLEGRNVVFEALKRQTRKVHRIVLDEAARPNPKLTKILTMASQQGVRLDRVARQSLDQWSQTGVHNGIMAEAEPLSEWTVAARLEDLITRGELPFFVLVDEVSYEHNLGAILRSALGAGVHAVVVPVRRGKGLTPVVQRVAMGGAESVPLIREGLASSLATLRRAGVRIIGADMDGEPCWDVPMTGSLALVLGGEDKGLTSTIRDRCDAIARVPLAGELESLNVSVTAATLMFEKVRQDQS